MSSKHLFLLLAGTLLGIVFWMAWIPNTLDIVDGADYAWYQSLFLMHDAVTGAADRRLIVSNAYYGWPFWLVTFAASFPFFGNGWENESGVLLASRFVTCVFGVAGVVTFGATLSEEVRRRQMGNVWLVLPCLLLVLLMPIWWKMVVRIHPQMMLFFFEVLVLFFLNRDEGRLSKYYWAAVGAAGCALAIKIEAAMMAPMFLAYTLRVLLLSRTDPRHGLTALLGGAAAAFVIFVLLNPYVLTAAGRHYWIQANLGNLVDLRHSGEKHSVWEVSSHLSQNYFPFVLACLLLGSLWFDAIKAFRQRSLSSSQWLAPYITICLIFRLFYVTKANPYYWLAPMSFLTFGMVPFFAAASIGIPVVAAAVLLVSLSPSARVTASLFAERAQQIVYPDALGKAVTLADAKRFSRGQAAAFAPLLQGARRPLISISGHRPSDVDFRALGVRYVERFYGCLKQEDLKPQPGHRLSLPEVDLVIIRKNDDMLRPGQCPEMTKLLRSWEHREDPRYFPLKETPYLVAFGPNKQGSRPDVQSVENIWNKLKR